MTRTAAERYAAALADSNLGRTASARRHLAAAARLAVDPDLAARIAGTSAYLEAESGDPATALGRCREAAERPGLSPYTRAVLVGQVGLIEMRRGDAAAALEHLGWAIRRLPSDPAALGRLALNRGDVHLQEGDLRHAAEDFHRAQRAFARAGLPVDAAKARHNEGYTAFLQGELLPALDAMGEARPVLAAASPVLEAVCDLDRAEVLLAAGMPGDAAGLLAGAVQVAAARRLPRQRAEAELVLARTLRFRDPVAAARIARASAARFRRQGNETWALRADAAALLADVAAGRSPDPPLLEATAERLRRSGGKDDAQRLTIAAARLRIRRGETDALDRIRIGRTAPVPVRLRLSEARVELALRRGRPADALAAAAAGLDQLTAAQAVLGSVDLATSLVLHARPLLQAGTAVAVQRHDPALVYAWSERARSLAARIPPLKPPQDPAVSHAVAELRRLRAMGSADPKREGELVRQLQDLAWRARGGRTAPIVPLDVVQARLAVTGGVAVAMTWTPDRADAVVLGAGDARCVALGASAPLADLLDGLQADLDLAAARLPERLAEAVRASLSDRLGRLAGRLVGPLGLPAEGPVVLSVPGLLAPIPWAMLPGLGGRPLTVATSLSRWSAMTPAPLSAAAFVAGPDVPRAAEEVARAAAHWPGAVALQGDGASCAAAAGAAAEADVLHCSAHGRHSPEQPLLSAVELADGPWFGYDVERLPRVPAVVVLSACDVGRAGTRWGQETTGLARAWLHAGARSVIASASAVGDDEACETLAALHAHLRSGRSPAEALALAGPPTSFVCAGV
ncbi:MAG TPA: CHAT domain-containing protein [Amnibacterium sp.]|uniref:CHAT domain-containing protein n=1 Tax=Amnibacterium sp. TaxID=1872496 RepID=UPI002F959A0A